MTRILERVVGQGQGTGDAVSNVSPSATLAHVHTDSGDDSCNENADDSEHAGDGTAVVHEPVTRGSISDEHVKTNRGGHTRGGLHLLCR